MTVLQMTALLFLLAALFGQINYHFLKLPGTIGLVIVALMVSLSAMALDAAVPGSVVADQMRSLIDAVDFRDTLMNGMLCFLLFAGALHLNLSDLRQEKWAVGILATVGVALSTLLVGFGFHLLTGVPLAVALVFGALISPTDPIAVVGLLRPAGAPKALEIKIVGESLFNDGVGVVAFVTLAAIAFGGGHGPTGAGEILHLFALEVIGGLVLGLGTGWITYLLLRRVDEYNLEIIMTLALVTGVYAVADALHVSGPLAVVAAGVLIGNQGLRYAMSETTRQHMVAFWNLIDEILNALLFLLIGLEVVAVSTATGHILMALAAIPLVLMARLVSISVPSMIVAPWRGFDTRAAAVLTWGGLRGGISVALALSLPDSEERTLLLTATYAVVIVSIIVQGLTVRRLVERLWPKSTGAAAASA